MLFTPMEPGDIVMGEVMWGATRAALSAAAVLIAAAAFGLISSPLALLAIPVAYLIGVAFASMAMILTATATTIGAMNNFFTLFLLPMFYVSGVFFPLRQAAGPHSPARGVGAAADARRRLTRGLAFGELAPWMLLWTAELAAFAAVSLYIASRLMRRRLVK